MKFYGRFELGPFAPGQGLTVANSLRRSLLSQLTGTAIPLVEISGASHEYETLTGVRESVLDILNIKQIIHPILNSFLHRLAFKCQRTGYYSCKFKIT
jgi:DNA-directed RNA polymerase alpha subunit